MCRAVQTCSSCISASLRVSQRVWHWMERIGLRRGLAIGLVVLGQCCPSSHANSDAGRPPSSQRDRACSALLAYFGNKKRGGGGSSSAAPSLKPQQLKGMERWLGLTGRDECRDNLQRSALILAAMQGDVEAVKLLVEHGYDVNGRDANMLTPLHYASWKGHSEVVSRLLASGADPCLYDNFGTTPLHKAAAFGQRVILQQLLRTGRVPVDAKTGPVLAPPHYEAVSLHQTPLQVVLRPSSHVTGEDRRAMAASLLDFGADPNQRDVRGRTCLHYAIELCDPRVLWMLMRAGADASLEDGEGRTAMAMLTWRNAWMAPMLALM